jgi:hypothetical protein
MRLREHPGTRLRAEPSNQITPSARTRRSAPRSALGMATIRRSAWRPPATRFTAAETGRPADASALLGERSGEDWISRRVAPNGVTTGAATSLITTNRAQGSSGRAPEGHHLALDDRRIERIERIELVRRHPAASSR